MSYVRVSILGTTVGGEVWSINPVFDPTGELEVGISQANLDAAAVAIAQLSPGGDLLSTMSPAMSIVGARLEIRADADDSLLAISIAGRSTPLVGTGSVLQPSQAAIVFSLRTNTPGGSGRGRVYWPAMGVQLNTSGRMGTSGTTTWVGAFKTYMAGIDSALSTAFTLIGFDLAVRSRTTLSTPHVVRIQAGDLVDTQRRRRDSLPETYVTVNVP